MGQVLSETIRDWAGGVITALEPDEIPSNASPRVLNGCFVSVGGGKAVTAKRRGMRCMNATPITGSPAIIGQHEFAHLSSGVLSRYGLKISNSGRIDWMNTGGTLTTIDATGLTAGDLYPDIVTASNRAFIVNGTDRKKVAIVAGSPVVQNFGITRPVVGTFSGSAGAAGIPNATYELRVVYYNGNTGALSSASDTASATVTLTSDKLDVANVPVSPDSQVTERWIFVRNIATMRNFYFVHNIADNVSTSATGIDWTDANLIIVAPDTAENDPPPAGVKYIAWHRGRLFVADDSQLYYSKELLPEAFDPDNVESVNPDDGQKLTGLAVLGNALIIFKTNSMYTLVGDDPAEWSVQQLDPDIGAISHRSIDTADGILYWWSEQGPASWISGSPRLIGQDLIPTLCGPTGDGVNYDQQHLICSGVDFVNRRILWGVPGSGQTRNTKILSYNLALQRFEGMWDPMDVASFGVAEDLEGQPWLFLGGYRGQVFKVWDADNDGIATGTSTGTFVAAATSISSITDLLATFDTTGAGLVERKVTLLNSDGDQVGSSRPRVTANTGTVLTLETPIVGLTVAATYTYIVGGPNWQFDTYWGDFALPFYKKRFEYLYVIARLTSSSHVVYADITFNFDTSSELTTTLSFTSGAGDSVWDSSVWDVGRWDSQSIAYARKRIAKTGRVWRARFRNAHANQPIVLLKVSVRVELLTDKS